MIAQSFKIRDFCNAVMNLEVAEVMSAASAEISELRRGRKAKGLRSEPDEGTPEKIYCDDLMGLVRILMGSTPSDLRPDFENEVRPLLLQVGKKVRINSEIFRRLTAPTP